MNACRVQDLAAAVCIVLVQPPLRVWFHDTYDQWFKASAHVGGIVSFLCLGGACSNFCSLGWAVLACQLLLANAGAGHVDMATRLRLACNGGAIGNESRCFLSVLL